MTLAVPTSLEPMLAQFSPEVPTGPEWIYEPKWDGFRCLAFRDGDTVAVQSKAGLTREAARSTTWASARG